MGGAPFDCRAARCKAHALSTTPSFSQPLIVASVNGDLAKGFPLPAIPGLAFTNASSLQLNEGYAAFLADFTFAPA